MGKESILTSGVAALGIAMAPNDFIAGILFSVVTYVAGRQLWPESDLRDFARGLVLAIAFAVIVAMTHKSLPLDIVPQAKMALAALLAIPLGILVRNTANRLSTDGAKGLAVLILGVLGLGEKK